MSKRSERRAEAARQEREKRRIKRAQPKTESPAPKSDRASAGLSQSQQPRPWRLATVVRWFLAAMTTLGGAYVLYDLRPKVQIAKAESLDETNALETQFAITNNSTFDLNYFEGSCDINDIVLSDKARFINIAAQEAAVSRRKIKSGESVAIPCPLNSLINYIPRRVIHADVVIVAQYKYSIWWKPQKKRMPFVTKARTDGHLLWFPQPLDSN